MGAEGEGRGSRCFFLGLLVLYVFWKEGEQYQAMEAMRG